eukprot:TRINITY_DN2475_c0_g1_i1.p1 TRINITY_DN2475_c0_g1~~TRINITY_DN2475_c0_g1_i1.p1  ORF type:complete len:539 (+),score=51.25 TRINITY_DN2475_c0_g1_i1:131-1747(+)
MRSSTCPAGPRSAQSKSRHAAAAASRPDSFSTAAVPRSGRRQRAKGGPRLVVPPHCVSSEPPQSPSSPAGSDRYPAPPPLSAIRASRKAAQQQQLPPQQPSPRPQQQEQQQQVVAAAVELQLSIDYTTSRDSSVEVQSRPGALSAARGAVVRELTLSLSSPDAPQRQYTSPSVKSQARSGSEVSPGPPHRFVSPQGRGVRLATPLLTVAGSGMLPGHSANSARGSDKGPPWVPPSLGRSAVQTQGTSSQQGESPRGTSRHWSVGSRSGLIPTPSIDDNPQMRRSWLQRLGSWELRRQPLACSDAGDSESEADESRVGSVRRESTWPPGQGSGGLAQGQPRTLADFRLGMSVMHAYRGRGLVVEVTSMRVRVSFQMGCVTSYKPEALLDGRLQPEDAAGAAPGAARQSTMPIVGPERTDTMPAPGRAGTMPASADLQPTQGQSSQSLETRGSARPRSHGTVAQLTEHHGEPPTRRVLSGRTEPVASEPPQLTRQDTAPLADSPRLSPMGSPQKSPQMVPGMPQPPWKPRSPQNRSLPQG